MMFSRFGIGLTVGICGGVAGGLALGSQTQMKTVEARTVDPVTPLMKYDVPSRGPEYTQYMGHALSYDQSKRTPAWVMERLTLDTIGGEANRKKSNFGPDPKIHPLFTAKNEDYRGSGYSRGHMALSGEANRKKSNFGPDPKIHPLFTAKNEDYRGSGYSRGHMAPAANHKYSQAEMDQTFYLSNVVPQDHYNNAEYWNLMEAYARSLVKHHSAVYVISGPLFLPNYFEGTKAFVKYEVIGENHVAVPTHLFKVIVTESTNGTVNLGAFVVPNSRIRTNVKLTDFQVPLQKLESSAGLVIFPQLNRNSTYDLCRSDGCNLRGVRDFEFFAHNFKLQRARSRQELDVAWQEIVEEGASGHKGLKKIYEERAVKVAAAG